MASSRQTHGVSLEPVHNECRAQQSEITFTHMYNVLVPQKFTFDRGARKRPRDRSGLSDRVRNRLLPAFLVADQAGEPRADILWGVEGPNRPWDRSFHRIADTAERWEHSEN